MGRRCERRKSDIPLYFHLIIPIKRCAQDREAIVKSRCRILRKSTWCIERAFVNRDDTVPRSGLSLPRTDPKSSKQSAEKSQTLKSLSSSSRSSRRGPLLRQWRQSGGPSLSCMPAVVARPRTEECASAWPPKSLPRLPMQRLLGHQSRKVPMTC